MSNISLATNVLNSLGTFVQREISKYLLERETIELENNPRKIVVDKKEKLLCRAKDF